MISNVKLVAYLDAERNVSVQYMEEEDGFAYEHVPLTTVGTSRVRYKTAQPLKPRRFTVEDDADQGKD